MNFKIFIWCVLIKLVLSEENIVSIKLQQNNPLEFKTSADFLKLLTGLANRSYQEPIAVTNRIEKQNELKVVLGYKPTRPSYLPEPVTVPQLIPPGTPWPASPEDYVTKNNKTQVVLEAITLANRIDESNNETKVVLEYKPTRPSFLPELSTVQQLIPTGKPWPASPEDFNVSKNNKTQDVLGSVTLANRIEAKNETNIVLEYKPTRPSFLPEPSTVQQLIPPEKPLHALPEEQVTKSTLSPHLINRFPELTSTTTRPSTFSTRIVLTYKPQRPWYLPEPTYIGQIIPPGKPWPASLEEYASFSQTTYRPNRFENQKTEHDETVK